MIRFLSRDEQELQRVVVDGDGWCEGGRFAQNPKTARKKSAKIENLRSVCLFFFCSVCNTWVRGVLVPATGNGGERAHAAYCSIRLLFTRLASFTLQFFFFFFFNLLLMESALGTEGNESMREFTMKLKGLSASKNIKLLNSVTKLLEMNWNFTCCLG